MNKDTERPSPLRMRRLEAGLRIIDIANETGIPATRISQIERDDPPARRDESELIEAALAKKKPRVRNSFVGSKVKAAFLKLDRISVTTEDIAAAKELLREALKELGA